MRSLSYLDLKYQSAGINDFLRVAENRLMYSTVALEMLKCKKRKRKWRISRPASSISGSKHLQCRRNHVTPQIPTAWYVCFA